MEGLGGEVSSSFLGAIKARADVADPFEATIGQTESLANEFIGAGFGAFKRSDVADPFEATIGQTESLANEFIGAGLGAV